MRDFFSGRSENQDGRAGLWLVDIFNTSLQPLNGIQRNLIGCKISTFFHQVCFSGWSEKEKDGRPGLWSDETFSNSSLQPPNGNETWQENKYLTSSTNFVFLARLAYISYLQPLNEVQRNLIGCKFSTSSTVLFWSIGKPRWRPWPPIGWDILDLFPANAERNSIKLDRKQDLNDFYQVCVFGPIVKSRWPPWSPICRKKLLLLCSRWTEFNETW